MASSEQPDTDEVISDNLSAGNAGAEAEMPNAAQAEKQAVSHNAKNNAELTPRDRARAIFATMATVGVVGAAIGFGAPLISALMALHHFSNSTIGYNATMGGLATVVGAMFTPRIATRFGVVPAILSMMFVGALTFLGFYCFENIVVWFALRFILHFAMTVMFILSEFWVNSSAPAAKRAFILAVYAAAMGLGVTVGPILFSYIGSSGFLPFAVGCALTAVAAIPVTMARHFSPRFYEARHQPFLHHIFKMPSSTLAAFVFGAVQVGAVSLITPFGLHAGYSESQAGQLLTVVALGNVLLLVPISIISDRTGRSGLIIWLCAFLGCAGALLAPFLVRHSLGLKIDLFIIGGVSAGIYTLGLARLGTRFHGPALAAANSAFIFCYGIGILLGPALTGFMMDYYPISGFADTMALFFGVYVFFMLGARARNLFRS